MNNIDVCFSIYCQLVERCGKAKVDDMIDLVMLIDDPWSIYKMCVCNDDGEGAYIIRQFFLLNQLNK